MALYKFKVAQVEYLLKNFSPCANLPLRFMSIFSKDAKGYNLYRPNTSTHICTIVGDIIHNGANNSNYDFSSVWERKNLNYTDKLAIQHVLNYLKTL